MFTRQQQLNNECTHDEYYAQFVTETERLVVKERFSIPKMAEDLRGGDVHLNSRYSCQHHWDLMHVSPSALALAVQAGDNRSLSTRVCILKAAAKQLIGEL